MVGVKRFEIWLIALNPTVGSEISKNRPCLVISPDEANRYLSTVIIIPLTSTLKDYPTRVDCQFEGKNGQLAIDQIRSIDKTRLVRRLGVLDIDTCSSVCRTIAETFKY